MQGAQHSDEKAEYYGAAVLGALQVTAEESSSCGSGPP